MSKKLKITLIIIIAFLAIYLLICYYRPKHTIEKSLGIELPSECRVIKYKPHIKFFQKFFGAKISIKKENVEKIKISLSYRFKYGDGYELGCLRWTVPSWWKVYDSEIIFYYKFRPQSSEKVNFVKYDHDIETCITNENGKYYLYVSTEDHFSKYY